MERKIDVIETNLAIKMSNTDAKIDSVNLQLEKILELLKKK
jgi:hypothetical protein